MTLSDLAKKVASLFPRLRELPLHYVVETGKWKIEIRSEFGGWEISPVLGDTPDEAIHGVVRQWLDGARKRGRENLAAANECNRRQEELEKALAEMEGGVA